VHRLTVHQFPCLDDNYGYLVHVEGSEITATIDTPDADAIGAELDRRRLRLTHILNTHWHPDHAGGNDALKQRFGAVTIGPEDAERRIQGLDRAVGEGAEVALGGVVAKVISVPGHTTDHIAFWFESDGMAFVGDALFPLGCGRLFEGSPAMMWTSLSKLKALPPTTLVYCAHEYTAANARFATMIDPDNQDLSARADEFVRLRVQGLPTVPTTIGLELGTNPFLRPDAAAIRQRLGMQDHGDVDVFAELRMRKDNFRG
jgi:hydroxyacylglutathione hydrolase